MDLSKIVCCELRWLKIDGSLKDMSCRVAMLRMHEDWNIQLPPARTKHHPPKKVVLTTATDPQSVISQPVHDLSPLQFHFIT
jgi:hypothetical protein